MTQQHLSGGLPFIGPNMTMRNINIMFNTSEKTHAEQSDAETHLSETDSIEVRGADDTCGAAAGARPRAIDTDERTFCGIDSGQTEFGFGEGVEKHSDEAVHSAVADVAEPTVKLQAIGFPTKRVSDDTLILARKAWLWASQQRWSGKKGVSRRALVEAYIKRLCLGNGEPIRGSVRERAEWARLSIGAVRRRTNDLIEMGFIQKEGIDEGGATLWRFGQAVHDIDLSHFPELSIEACLHFSDAAERRAAGPDGMRLWEILRLYGPLSPLDASERCGVTLRRAGRLYRHLRTCVEGFPLAAAEHGLWFALGPTDPGVDLAVWIAECVAAACETKGKGDARKETHQRERKQRDEYLKWLRTDGVRELRELPAAPPTS